MTVMTYEGIVEHGQIRLKSDIRLTEHAKVYVIIPSPDIAYPWADKQEQKRQVKALFAALSIQGAPIGAQALQQRMSQLDLSPNELSRGIIEAREE
ncbi:MAG: hypothetical protein JW850_14815 [Thermoflexales bacterium]|nr:hypothetical protein [Thermoflexales bacterium]